MSPATVKWSGGAVAQEMREAAADALEDACEALLTEANKTVPIEEGTLERSGSVSVDRLKLRGVVSYDTPYAVRQHEDTRIRHDEGRQAKWLERAFAQNGDRLVRFMRDRIAGRTRTTLLGKAIKDRSS